MSKYYSISFSLANSIIAKLVSSVSSPFARVPVQGVPVHKGLNILPKFAIIRSSFGLEVIKLEYRLRLKIKRNDWLLADTCPQTANYCALF